MVDIPTLLRSRRRQLEQLVKLGRTHFERERYAEKLRLVDVLIAREEEIDDHDEVVDASHHQS